MNPDVGRDGWVQWFSFPEKPRLRLLCFAHAGGGAGIFRDWVAHAPSDVQLGAVRMPGRDGRVGEPPMLRVMDAAEALGEALKADEGVPWAFFGHSLGALLAFETARYLSRQVRDMVRCLTVAGAASPSTPLRRPTFRLSADQLLASLLEIGALHSDLRTQPRLAALWLPRLRADLEMYDTYQYMDTGTLSCPVIAMLGMNDHTTTLLDVRAWTECTTGPSAVHCLRGDHFFPLAKPSVVLTAAVQGRALCT